MDLSGCDGERRRETGAHAMYPSD